MTAELVSSCRRQRRRDRRRRAQSEEVVGHETADRVVVLPVAAANPGNRAAAEIRGPVVPTEPEASEIFVDLSAHVVEQTLAPVAETSVVVKYSQSMSVSHIAQQVHVLFTEDVVIFRQLWLSMLHQATCTR